MKKFLLIAASVIVAVSAGVLAYLNSESRAEDFFSANVEALSDPELDNTHMFIWWVEYKGMSFTCTLGGWSPC